MARKGTAKHTYQKTRPFCVQNGNTKRPRTFSRLFAVQPIPRDLELCAPVPGSRQVSWLKDQHPPPPSRADAQWPVQTHPGGRLPYHSDEIVRDLRPLPFYPFLCGGTAQKGTCCRIQFYGVEYNTMRAETQGAVYTSFSPFARWRSRRRCSRPESGAWSRWRRATPSPPGCPRPWRAGRQCI